MNETVVIDPRFTGPPDSGNGGYVCGVLGSRLDGPAEVSLRRPPPIATPLGVRATGDGIALYDGDALVAEAKISAAISGEMAGARPDFADDNGKNDKHERSFASTTMRADQTGRTRAVCVLTAVD